MLPKGGVCKALPWFSLKSSTSETCHMSEIQPVAGRSLHNGAFHELCVHHQDSNCPVPSFWRLLFSSMKWALKITVLDLGDGWSLGGVFSSESHWYWYIWKHCRGFCSAEAFANDLSWSIRIYNQPCYLFRDKRHKHCSVQLLLICAPWGSRAQCQVLDQARSGVLMSLGIFANKGGRWGQVMIRQRVHENVGVILP